VAAGLLLPPLAMLIELTCSGDTTTADLNDGLVRVGGGRADEVRIAGLPAALVTLRIEGARLTVTTSAPLAIGRSMFAAHVPRLLVAGEIIQLAPDMRLRQVPLARKDKGTATVMRELLRGDLPVEQTRAPTLTCLTGRDAGNVIPLAFDQLVLGRADDCTLQIRDRAVSRRHARIVQHEGRFWVDDLRGANGTYINGRKVLRKTALQPGDVLEVGQTLLRYDAPQAPPPAPLPPTPPPAVAAEKVTEPEVTPLLPPPPPVQAKKWVALSCASGAVALLAATVAAILTAVF
jgi:hypothetical protein